MKQTEVREHKKTRSKKILMKIIKILKPKGRWGEGDCSTRLHGVTPQDTVTLILDYKFTYKATAIKSS
jgi:hypothetical protein